ARLPAVYTQTPTGGGFIMPACPLSLREREQIYYGLVRGLTITAIAAEVGRHRCTVSAEIARNGGRGCYRPFAANRRAVQCRKRPKMRLFERCPELAAHVASRLEAKDSPMTIAVELAQGVYPDIAATVSHETIYTEIYDHQRKALPREVFQCLHRQRRRRRRRGFRQPWDDGAYNWRRAIRSFRERPAEADARSEVGHFEGDLISGAKNQSAIITVFDRKSRHLWMAPLNNGRSGDIALDALTNLFERIPQRVRRTLTWDQGSEIAGHAALTRRVGIEVFVTDPQSPWQRPTNENGNGLIRRYVGKHTDLARFSATDIRAIEHRINTMPRRIHNWHSAQHVYHQAVAMTD
ncbi:MAG: IS30 family transposase, partial [Acidimicrobiia bacterium]|nr:IS30 family transposase [Acidimicrobiia bacterium]